MEKKWLTKYRRAGQDFFCLSLVSAFIYIFMKRNIKNYIGGGIRTGLYLALNSTTTRLGDVEWSGGHTSCIFGSQEFFGPEKNEWTQPRAHQILHISNSNNICRQISRLAVVSCHFLGPSFEGELKSTIQGLTLRGVVCKMIRFHFCWHHKFLLIYNKNVWRAPAKRRLGILQINISFQMLRIDAVWLFDTSENIVIPFWRKLHKNCCMPVRYAANEILFLGTLMK